MNYDDPEAQEEVVSWANRQGPDKAGAVAARLEELAKKAEEEDQHDGAEWLLFFSRRASNARLYPQVYLRPWAVVTNLEGKRYKRKFSSHYAAGEWIDRCKKKYPRAKQWIVNICEPQEKPPDVRLEPGHLWCPWCRAGRQFRSDWETSYTRCPVCRISTEDYFTRRTNFQSSERAGKESIQSHKDMRRRKKESRRRVRHGGD